MHRAPQVSQNKLCWIITHVNDNELLWFAWYWKRSKSRDFLIFVYLDLDVILQMDSSYEFLVSFSCCQLVNDLRLLWTIIKIEVRLFNSLHILAINCFRYPLDTLIRHLYFFLFINIRAEYVHWWDAWLLAANFCLMNIHRLHFLKRDGILFNNCEVIR